MAQKARCAAWASPLSAARLVWCGRHRQQDLVHPLGAGIWRHDPVLPLRRARASARCEGRLVGPAAARRAAERAQPDDPDHRPRGGAGGIRLSLSVAELAAGVEDELVEYPGSDPVSEKQRRKVAGLERAAWRKKQTQGGAGVVGRI